MKEYKSAIVVQGKDTRLAIVPYVKDVCGSTENIAFIVSRQGGGQCIGRCCDDLAEVIQIIEDVIFESVEED